ncbi:MAG: [LysW]-aminoadipate kinase [Chloroflexota bacterium]|nr:[LysW]-aminoadipate kinase [Chloroflexota bacterium]
MSFLGVLKLGGGAGVEHAAALANLAERIASGERWILVHGASDAANRLAAAHGVPVRTLTTPGGHTSRYTDAQTLDLFCEAAANVNTEMVETLRVHGIDAVGLADAEIVRAERKTAIRALVNGRQVIVRDDYTGAITNADADALWTLLDGGQTPVVAPLAAGGERGRLNVDGDRAAAAIARALSADALVILSNVPGLLRDVSDPASLVTSFALSDLPRYESYAAGRMKKKLLAASEAQIARVVLADSRIEYPLDAALNGGGTQIIQAMMMVGVRQVSPAQVGMVLAGAAD